MYNKRLAWQRIYITQNSLSFWLVKKEVNRGWAECIAKRRKETKERDSKGEKRKNDRGLVKGEGGGTKA